MCELKDRDLNDEASVTIRLGWERRCGRYARCSAQGYAYTRSNSAVMLQPCDVCCDDMPVGEMDNRYEVVIRLTNFKLKFVEIVCRHVNI